MNRSLEFRRSDALMALGFLSCLAVTFYAFWPGLTGPFLFDDFPNLRPLGLFGGVHDLRSTMQFILGGDAGPLGRPLSLATFLLNDNAWPSSPESFKYTNLLFHLLAGVCLFSLLIQIERARPPTSTPAGVIPLLATAIWLLHPIQTAPVFFIVQRMTILSALFVFAGLALWTAGRNRLVIGRPGGLRLMTLGIVAGTVLAAWSKENGALLPALALVLEKTIAPLPDRRALHVWRRIFLWLPSLAILAYLIARWGSFADSYRVREFTFGERMLTEPGVLADYVRQILFPKLTTSILRDDWPIVHHADAQAWLIYLCWAAAIIGAFVLRRRAPLPAFAVLFFIATQMLESGPVPLELYYLHRNYLPMVGILYALAAVPFLALRDKPWVAAILAVAYVVLCGTITRLESVYWGDERLLLTAWNHERPGSARSAAMAADYWAGRQQFEQAIHITRRTLALAPNSLSLRLGQYYLLCIVHREDRSEWDKVMEGLPVVARDNATINALGMLANAISNGICSKISLADLNAALDRVAANPHFQSAQDLGEIEFARAESFRRMEDFGSAAQALEKSLGHQKTVYAYLALGDLLANLGRTSEARHAYEQALQINLFDDWRALLFDRPPPWDEEVRAKIETLETRPEPARSLMVPHHYQQ